MKIVSWNVNGIRAVANKGFLTFYEETSPDVLCLQETKVHPEQLEPELVRPLGCCSYWSAASRRGYSGTATFCKTPPHEAVYGIGVRKFDSEGRFVITDHRDFLLYNVYFPNGGSGPERHAFKQEFLRKFNRHLQRQIAAGREIVLVGDYNIARMDIDVYDPVRLSSASGFLPEERAWFEEFLAGGFVDCFRQFHPEERDRYSWWSYRENARMGNRGWRIDYVCVTKGLAARVKDCNIWDHVTGSDHCPVYVDIDV